MNGLKQSPRQPQFFYWLAILLGPVGFFISLELVLRLIGFGGDYPLFRDFDGLPGMRVVNEQVMNRYVYGGDSPITAPDPFLFAREKPDEGVRLVVQGGSSAAGFPYGRWGGLAGMLDTRIEITDPGLPFEVIGTAMAAVNSYTLIDLVDEIIEIEPDAILVYAGHNEFLGLLGVGSSLDARSSAWSARLHLALQPFRVYQLADRIAAAVRGWAQSEAGETQTSIFEQAATGAKIASDSPAYRAGLEQFESNLRILLSKYASAGIPVYLGTLVSNESGLAPFDGGPEASVDPGAWAVLQQEREDHRASGAVEAERATIARMLNLDERSADAWFARGELAFLSGDEDQARKAFALARDHDRLRFRAPSAFNQIIRQLAQEYGAEVVEVRERFLAHSPDGSIGANLMLEHVHPNREGYWILADAFYEALLRDGLLRPPPHELGPDFRKELIVPLTRIDLLVAQYRMSDMMSRYPFVEETIEIEKPQPTGEIEQLALRYHEGSMSWIEMMEALLQIHLAEGRLWKAARVARLTAREYPTDVAPNLAAGLLWMRLESVALARLYLERALRVAPDDPRVLAALAELDQRETGVEGSTLRRRTDPAERSPGQPIFREHSDSFRQRPEDGLVSPGF